MANNYCQWSEEVEELTREEAEWLRIQIQHTFFCDACNERRNEDGLKETSNCYVCGNELSEAETDTGEIWPGFDYELVDDRLWMYSRENYAADPACDLMQKFLAMFRPTEIFKVCIAYTCSKMHIGEFGGAGTVVSAWGQETRQFDDLGAEEAALMARKPVEVKLDEDTQ